MSYGYQPFTYPDAWIFTPNAVKKYQLEVDTVFHLKTSSSGTNSGIILKTVDTNFKGWISDQSHSHSHSHTLSNSKSITTPAKVSIDTATGIVRTHNSISVANVQMSITSSQTNPPVRASTNSSTMIPTNSSAVLTTNEPTGSPTNLSTHMPNATNITCMDSSDESLYVTVDIVLLSLAAFVFVVLALYCCYRHLGKNSLTSPEEVGGFYSGSELQQGYNV